MAVRAKSVTPLPENAPYAGSWFRIEYWVPQYNDMWCWAACASAVLKFRQQNVQQCDLAAEAANEYFQGFPPPGTNCCLQSGLCNFGVTAPDLATLLNTAYKFTAVEEKVGAARSSELFQDLVAQLTNGSLVIAGLNPPGGVGMHMVLVFGQLDAKTFYVYDPRCGVKQCGPGTTAQNFACTILGLKTYLYGPWLERIKRL